jgi:two-component system, LytTR family, sensor kinase
VKRTRPAEVSIADALPAWALRRYETTLILAAWLAFGVIFTGNRLVASAQAGDPMPFRIAATIGFAMAAVWAINTIVIFSLSRRFPLDRRPRTTRVLIHLLAGMMIAAIEAAAEGMIGVLTGLVPSVDEFLRFFYGSFPFNIVVYWLIVGVAHGMMFYRRYRQRDAEAAVLASRLASAELEVLKSQLHPHFLFNAMNTISALMHRDVKAADRMLARLSELLRAALDHTSEQEVSLSDELNFLESYLEIEQTRFGERLRVEVDVPPNVLDAVVPHMIMQPLVENAIRHGVAPRAAVGTVTIRARGRRDMLDLEVLDDGPGVPPGRSTNGGLGLANVKARLQQLYGDRFSFEPRNRAEGGFRVTLSIPFRPIEADDPEE